MRRTFHAAPPRGVLVGLIAALLLSAGPAAAQGKGEAQATRAEASPLAPGAGYGDPHGSERVRALQLRLRRAGESPGPIDGLFGPLTEAAVRRFQARQGLAVDGLVGPLTAAALKRQAALIAPGAGYGDPRGSERVEALQLRLRRSGLSPGPIDGRFGPLTEAAVRRFQAARRLATTGLVGRQTRLALAGRSAPSATETETQKEDKKKAKEIENETRRAATAPAPERGARPRASGQERRGEAPRGERAESRAEGPKPGGEPQAAAGRKEDEEPGLKLGPWEAIVALATALALLAALLFARGGPARPAKEGPPKRRPGPAVDYRPVARRRAPGPAPAEARRSEPAPAPSARTEGRPRRRAPAQAEAPLANGPGEAPMLGYAIVSAREGSVDRGELSAQAEAIAAECARSGLRLLELVREREPRNGKVLERPGLRYACERIEAGEAGGLVVSELSRLGRSAAELGEIVGWFLRSGARLVAVAQGLDTDQPGGRLAARTLTQVSDWERERLSERTQRGLKAAQAAGRQGRPAVGDDRELRERIAAMRAGGMTLQAIADRLNAEGVPTVRGGAMWRPSSVQGAVGYKRRRQAAPEQAAGRER
jgi:peptidoglycan hydrolase-like protein with peptidoglycan-binding domain/DNA invertase Pin-like site-specific DNA recombinase